MGAVISPVCRVCNTASVLRHVAGRRFDNCDLEAIGGVTSFAGAIVASTVLIPLTHASANVRQVIEESDT